MKIFRKDFTVEVFRNEVLYEGARFRIKIKKNDLTEFEKDLLRYVFAGKSLPFKIPDNKKIVYSRSSNLSLNFTSVPTYKDFTQRFGDYYIDYTNSNLVLPGKDVVIIKMIYNTPESICYSDGDVEITTVGLEGLHPMFYEFIRKRDVDVIGEYIPWGNGLKTYIKGVVNKTNITMVYKNKEIGEFVLDNETNVVTGTAVFRNGIARIKVPLDAFKEIEENLHFGKMPDKHVEEVIITYPRLKEWIDVSFYGWYGRYGTRSRIVFSKGNSWSSYCTVEAEFSNNRSIFDCKGKTKKASLKSLPKYLREAGFVEE